MSLALQFNLHKPTIREHDHPLRLRYYEFKLVSATGREFAAIPPFDMRGTVTQQVASFSYPMVGFGVAPYLSPYYPRLSLFPGPFAHDPLSYDRYYPVFARISLPTADMVQKALPEGVLEPRGRVSEFLYFENVGADVARADFRADLINAGTSEELAEVNIPFIVTG